MSRHVRLRRAHAALGLVIGAFVLVHLANQALALLGRDTYVALLTALQAIYRQPLVELVLLAALAAQIVLGITMLPRAGRRASNRVDWLQIAAGGYLAAFIVVHVGAVLVTRATGIETGLAFALAGYQAGWIYLVAPYHALAVIAVFAHLGCARYWHTQQHDARRAAKYLTSTLALGFMLALAIGFGLFRLAEIAPEANLS